MKLTAINECNWMDALNLEVQDHQKKFVASSAGILARAYAYRSSRARAFLIENEEGHVGLLMVRDLEDEPKCYELQQLMIHKTQQGKGYGLEALRLILEELAQEGKYQRVDICVDREDIPAIKLYEKVGFIDTGYIDEEVPNSLNLTYLLK